MEVVVTCLWVMVGGCIGVSVMALVSSNRYNQEAGLREDGQRFRALINTHHALMPEGGQWWVEGPTGQGVASPDPRTAVDQACINILLRLKRDVEEEATT
jgi:hypothetical protein